MSFRKPRWFALTLTLSLVLSYCVTGAAKSPDRPPNILLIMADDLGFSDLGCYGGEIRTPNLDGLAERGLRFTQFYNTARCWPTRGALLTGYYAQQIRRDAIPGIPSGGRGKRPSWAKLLPVLLRDKGYRSYHTGKWHIDGMPVAEGFDRSYYVKDQGRFFHPTKHWLDDKPLPPVAKDTDFYATRALADHVIQCLQDHATSYADRPFFQYLAFAAPHFPLQALPEDIAKYEGQYDAGWDVVRAQRFAKQKALGVVDSRQVPRLSVVEQDIGPPYHFPNALEILGPGEVNRPIPWARLNAEQQQFQSQKMALHAAMIHRMDIEIGRVLEQIEEMNELDNTIVLFLSDNGASAEIMVRDDGHDPEVSPGAAGSYLCLGPGWSTACNTPFRRHKTWTHEGGISTPLVVSWPDGIKAFGEVRETPGHVIDIVPTLLDLAGVSENSSAPSRPGESLRPALVGEQKQRQRTFWWFHDGHRAIRVGDWKAVSPLKESWQLYNLANDRIESRDLAVIESEQTERLAAEWEAMRVSITKLATEDLDDQVQQKAMTAYDSDEVKNKAQEAALPTRRQVLVNGEHLKVKDRPAFVMRPRKAVVGDRKPWIMYAPTLRGIPDRAESWMHEKFLEAGVAVAGIDVGEMYGSPRAFVFFDALVAHMVQQGYSDKPALLCRSRGGLWASSWAMARPENVACIGGIYPVFDFRSYPGLSNAAGAYGLNAEQLEAQAEQLNPIQQAGRLARAEIPVYLIHGEVDKIVPIEANSAALEAAYVEAGKAELIQVQRVPGQGHNFWEGFFRCESLIEFLIDGAQAK